MPLHLFRIELVANALENFAENEISGIRHALTRRVGARAFLFQSPCRPSVRDEKLFDLDVLSQVVCADIGREDRSLAVRCNAGR